MNYSQPKFCIARRKPLILCSVLVVVFFLSFSPSIPIDFVQQNMGATKQSEKCVILIFKLNS